MGAAVLIDKIFDIVLYMPVYAHQEAQAPRHKSKPKKKKY